MWIENTRTQNHFYPQTALNIPPGAPPPWLINMQRYGPPPSYPNMKIAGLNSPIPETWVQFFFSFSFSSSSPFFLLCPHSRLYLYLVLSGDITLVDGASLLLMRFVHVLFFFTSFFVWFEFSSSTEAWNPAVWRRLWSVPSPSPASRGQIPSSFKIKSVAES